jgi:hypothetical protein
MATERSFGRAFRRHCAFGLALYRGVTLSLLRIVMLLGVLHLSLSQMRHADLLGMLAPIFLARPLAEQFAALARDPARTMVRTSIWSSAAAVAFMIGVTGLASQRHDLSPPARITPANAIHSLDVARGGPILNEYDFGGYLDFIGVAPFIDGRGELYGETYMRRHHRTLLTTSPWCIRDVDHS